MSESCTLPSVKDLHEIKKTMKSIKSQSDSINTYNYVNNLIHGINGLKAANNELLTKIEAVEVTLSNYQINYKDVNGVLKMNELTENLNVNAAKENIKVIVKTLEQLKEKHDTEDNVQTTTTRMEFSDEDNKHIEAITKETNLLERSIKTIIDEICRIQRIIENINNKDYKIPTTQKPAYVVMFANYEFSDEDQYSKLPGLKIDITKAKNIFKSDSGFELQNKYSKKYENLSKEDTINKIKELKDKSFDDYSSLIIIFNSHGGSDGKLITQDSENINITDFYEACEENPTLTNKPVIMIFEACRGKGEDRISTIGPPTKAIFHRFYPERNNYLIVYATSDGNKALFIKKEASIESGSRFLQTFFPIVEKHRNWDILAQLTKTTNEVLQKCEPYEYEWDHPFNQTVTFISLFPRQFRFSGASIDNWDDMSTYSSGNKVHVLFKEGKTTALFTQDKQRIKDAIKEAGFIENCTETESGNIHTTIIITLGIASDGQIHNMLPKLQKEYSFINKPKLGGRPKVFLNLGISSLCIIKPYASLSHQFIFIHIQCTTCCTMRVYTHSMKTHSIREVHDCM